MSDNGDVRELASQQIQVQSKRFYIDVKENQRGRFIKLAEVGSEGRKSRILLTMGAAEELKKYLGEFSDLHSQMGSNQEAKSGRDGDVLIKSETFIKERKRYYLDLKENQRGRFLRISMIVPGPGGARTQVAIPAQGLLEFKDHLTDLLERFNTLPENETNEAEDSHSDGKQIRADNKTFFFDFGSNQRGSFLKISEVRQDRYRTSITVPEEVLAQFSEQVREFAERGAAQN